MHEDKSGAPATRGLLAKTKIAWLCPLAFVPVSLLLADRNTCPTNGFFQASAGTDGSADPAGKPFYIKRRVLATGNPLAIRGQSAAIGGNPALKRGNRPFGCKQRHTFYEGSETLGRAETPFLYY